MYKSTFAYHSYKSFDCVVLEGFFLILWNHLTKFDMLISSVNWNKTAHLKNEKKLLHDFLANTKQGWVLNGQVSSWANVKAVDSQSSMLDPLLFLTYVNDLLKVLSSNAKLFTDDTSLFSVIHDTTRNEVNDDFL